MNEIIPPFITDQKNIYPIIQDGHKYELFIQDDYGLNNNLASLGSDERMFTSKIQFKVLGYLVGDSVNQNRPQIVKRQNAVNIIIGSERTMLNDSNDNTDDSGIGCGDSCEERELFFEFDETSEILDEDDEVIASTRTKGEFREF